MGSADATGRRVRLLTDPPALRNDGRESAAGERHAPPQELCQLFTRYSEAEEKVVKFIDVHASSCGIPQQVLTTTKANHAKTGEMRQRICSVAAPGERRGPGLGEALGMRAVPTPDTTSTGKGTLDTLSGNALAR